VLPDNTIDLSEELLNEMHKVWFECTREQFGSNIVKQAHQNKKHSFRGAFCFMC
jgi:hypothetical protein